ncbi:hypothetical protein G6F58_003688 [Rhizopus delemar]|nr:hypothetical protein G6F58_003688 [Rhizopus delemar]
MDFLKNPLQHSGIVDLRSSVVLPLIVDFLLSHSLPAESRAPIQMDDRQAFVFKQLRPKKLIQSLDGVFSLFFTAVDQLPHTFDCVVINPQTSLCLTLGDVSISTSSCPLPKSMACLPSSNAYQVDLTSGRLQRKCFTDIRSRPYLTKRFLKWVRSDKLKLSSFFVRTFLLPCSAPLNDPPFTPVVHTRSRNIWYCTLHNKLSCRSNLYMPSKICLICSGHEEAPLHFLFECSQKLAAWSSLWVSQFELPFSTYSLRRAIFLLEFPKCRSNTSTVPSIFLGTLLLALWGNHWSFVFDGRPFLANIVIASAKQLLFISLQESLFSNRVSPLPLPHVQLP